MKLTDTQLVLLSKASQRDDRGIEKPEALNGAIASKVVDRLITSGLVEEVPCHGALPEWRKDEAGRYALIVTAKGLEAIGVPTPPGAPTKSKQASNDTKRNVGPQRKPKASAGPNRGTKSDQLIDLLRTKQGASIDEVTQSFGWQRHTARAAISGLRKDGFNIERTTGEDKASVYRITAAPKTNSRRSPRPDAGAHK